MAHRWRVHNFYICLANVRRLDTVRRVRHLLPSPTCAFSTFYSRAFHKDETRSGSATSATTTFVK